MSNQPFTGSSDVDWSLLPAPEDDGGASHLQGLGLPTLPLTSTSGEEVDLSEIVGRTVVYIYPMTGKPDRPLPDGWDEIPGARGCTPQSCAFRDHAEELGALGIRQIFGLSTQDSVWQREAATRLHLPFALLSDNALRLADELDLPRFETGGMVLLKRLTMVLRDGMIEQVFYPVFPPDQSAQTVIDWLKANPTVKD
ncbi:MAG: peroxiredoxin [Rhodobacteraceae bacterium]|nr:peroxiredoxin [Paracoccaceae bacterium]